MGAGTIVLLVVVFCILRVFVMRRRARDAQVGANLHEVAARQPWHLRKQRSESRWFGTGDGF